MNQNDDVHSFPTRAAPIVSDLVDPDDAASLNAWCAELKTTEDALRRAVLAVGAMPNAIRFYFRGAPSRVKELSADRKAAFIARARKRRGRTARRHSRNDGTVAE